MLFLSLQKSWKHAQRARLAIL